jgi:hypothetical protein
VNTKEKDGTLLAAVTDILRTWCDNCRYRYKSKKEERNDGNGDGHDNSNNKPIYCYFIKQNNYVKIGSSSDPIRRAEALQHYTPHKTRLLYYTQAVSETDMHRKWQALRTKGEWFLFNNALRVYIDALIKRDKEAQERENEKVIQ